MDINTLFEASFKEVDEKVGNLFKIQSSEVKSLLKQIKEFKDRITKSKNFLNAQTALRGAEKNIARSKVDPEEIKSKIQDEINSSKSTRDQYIQLSNHKATANLLKILNQMKQKGEYCNTQFKSPAFHLFNSKIDPKRYFIGYINERLDANNFKTDLPQLDKKGNVIYGEDGKPIIKKTTIKPTIMNIFEELYYSNIINSNPELKNAVGAIYKCYNDLKKTFNIDSDKNVKIINQDEFNKKFQTFYNIIKSVSKDVEDEMNKINNEIKGYKTNEDKFSKRNKELGDYLEQNKGKNFFNVSTEDLKYYSKKYNEFLDAKEALMSININSDNNTEIKSDIAKSFEEIKNIKKSFEGIKKKLEEDGITEKYFIENYRKIRASNEALFNIIFDTYNFFYNTNMSKEQKKEILVKGDIYDDKLHKGRDEASNIIEHLRKFPGTENTINYIYGEFFGDKQKTDIKDVEKEIKNLISGISILKEKYKNVEKNRKEMEKKLSKSPEKNKANDRYYKVLKEINDRIDLINYISEFYSSIGKLKETEKELEQASDISKIINLIDNFKKQEKNSIEEINRKFIEEQLGKDKAKEYILNMWKSGGNQPNKVFKTKEDESKFFASWRDPYRQKADEIFNEANKLAKQKEELRQKKIGEQIAAERKIEAEAASRAKEAQAEYYGGVSKDNENTADEQRRSKEDEEKAKSGSGIRDRDLEDVLKDPDEEDRLTKKSKKVLAELSGKKPSKVKKNHVVVIKKKPTRKLNNYTKQVMKEIIDKE